MGGRLRALLAGPVGGVVGAVIAALCVGVAYLSADPLLGVVAISVLAIAAILWPAPGSRVAVLAVALGAGAAPAQAQPSWCPPADVAGPELRLVEGCPAPWSGDLLAPGQLALRLRMAGADASRAQRRLLEVETQLKVCKDNLEQAKNQVATPSPNPGPGGSSPPAPAQPPGPGPSAPGIAALPQPARAAAVEGRMPWWGPLVLAGLAASVSLSTFWICLEAGGSQGECLAATSTITAATVGGVGLAL